MQCLGGACILLAATLCTASQSATENLCKAVSFGHFVSTAIKMYALITGWAGDTRKGAFAKGSTTTIEMGFHLTLASQLQKDSRGQD